MCSPHYTIFIYPKLYHSGNKNVHRPFKVFYLYQVFIVLSKYKVISMRSVLTISVVSTAYSITIMLFVMNMKNLINWIL